MLASAGPTAKVADRPLSGRKPYFPLGRFHLQGTVRIKGEPLLPGAFCLLMSLSIEPVFRTLTAGRDEGDAWYNED